jgi:hypothetical protein
MPAVWQGQALVAAPLPGVAQEGWSVRLVHADTHFLTSINAD